MTDWKTKFLMATEGEFDTLVVPENFDPVRFPEEELTSRLDALLSLDVIARHPSRVIPAFDRMREQMDNRGELTARFHEIAEPLLLRAVEYAYDRCVGQRRGYEAYARSVKPTPGDLTFAATLLESEYMWFVGQRGLEVPAVNALCESLAGYVEEIGWKLETTNKILVNKVQSTTFVLREYRAMAGFLGTGGMRFLPEIGPMVSLEKVMSLVRRTGILPVLEEILACDAPEMLQSVVATAWDAAVWPDAALEQVLKGSDEHLAAFFEVAPKEVVVRFSRAQIAHVLSRVPFPVKHRLFAMLPLLNPSVGTAEGRGRD